MMRVLAPSLLLSMSLAAQTTPCLALNDQNTAVSAAITSFGFAGPNVQGWQITPATVLLAQSLQIYTGNVNFTPGFETLEVWDNNPVTNLPNARLAGGTWQIDRNLGAPATGNAWQGCNLDAIATLLPGFSYWIVWTDPGFSTVPTEPGGTTVPSARRSGTTWAAAAASALKVRVHCNLLDSASSAPYGPACATSQGRLGTLFTNQAPSIGNGFFRVEGTGFTAGSTALLLLGVNPSWMSVPIPGLPSGCALNTDLYVLLTGVTGTGTTVRSVAGTPGYAGNVTFPLPIPGDPSLVGFFLAAQVGVIDAGAAVPLPVVMSNALRSYLF